MGPGKNIIGSWIWEVLNPEIDYLDFEADLLQRGLTFREHKRDFERLKPLREALMPDGRAVFDDMKGELADHDSLVERHDRALSDLREKAIALFDALLEHEPFRETFSQVVQGPQSQGVTQTPGLPHQERWLRLIAADVVNDFPGDLEDNFAEYQIWNRFHARLKSAAPEHKLQQLHESRAGFAMTVRDTRQAIATLRKTLSRNNDIPVVPSGSFG